MISTVSLERGPNTGRFCLLVPLGPDLPLVTVGKEQ